MTIPLPITFSAPELPKIGTIGLPVKGIEVRLADTNSQGVGELQIKGPIVMQGYYHNEAANKEVFTEDGWFRTGDVGYLDEDEYCFITGRLKTVIVLESGKNVFPEEIEEYLANIDLIAESVVVGRSQGRTEKVILTAIVYPDYTKFDDNVSEDTVLRAVQNAINSMNKKLPSYKQVKGVEIRNTEFEKTTSRKIKRHLVQ